MACKAEGGGRRAEGPKGRAAQAQWCDQQIQSDSIILIVTLACKGIGDNATESHKMWSGVDGRNHSVADSR